MAKKSQPECSECGASGADAQFSIFSPHGFGTYCVECEEKKGESTDNVCSFEVMDGGRG